MKISRAFIKLGNASSLELKDRDIIGECVIDIYGDKKDWTDYIKFFGKDIIFTGNILKAEKGISIKIDIKKDYFKNNYIRMNNFGYK